MSVKMSTNGEERPQLARASTTSSKLSTKPGSRMGLSYWNDLINVFAGTNRDLSLPSAPQFPTPVQQRPGSRRSSTVYSRRVSTSSSEGEPTMTTQFAKRQKSALSSKASRRRSRSPRALQPVPEGDVQTPRYCVPVQRDGRTIWVPEEILNQFSPPVHKNENNDVRALAESESVSAAKAAGRPARPTMTIDIPHSSSGVNRAASPSSVYTVETNNYRSHNRSPSSAQSSSNNDSGSSDGWDASPRSSATSRSSFDIPSPLSSSARLSRKYSIQDPAAAGIFSAKKETVPQAPPPRNPKRMSIAHKAPASPTFTEAEIDLNRELTKSSHFTSGESEAPKASLERPSEQPTRSAAPVKAASPVRRKLIKRTLTSRQLPAVGKPFSKIRVPFSKSSKTTPSTVSEETRASAATRPKISHPLELASKASTQNLLAGPANTVTPTPTPPTTTPQDAEISASDAENVLFGLLAHCTSLDDLSSMARTNRGFYSVYRRNALRLTQSALRNGSPAVYRFVQQSWAAPPATPIELVHRYVEAVEPLKRLLSIIETNCRPYLRDTTSSNSPQSVEALATISLFCSEFHSDPTDITSQLSFLSSLSPTASSIHNVLELFTALRTLLTTTLIPSDSNPSLAFARAENFGVFSAFPPAALSTDELREEAFDSWVSHIHSLGPASILTLMNSPDAYAAASTSGLTTWDPVAASDLEGFLVVSATELYDSLLTAPAPNLNRLATRRKSATLALQLREMKASGATADAEFSEERPMSVLSASTTSLVPSTFDGLASTIASGMATPRARSPDHSALPPGEERGRKLSRSPERIAADVMDSPVFSPESPTQTRINQLAAERGRPRTREGFVDMFYTQHPLSSSKDETFSSSSSGSVSGAVTPLAHPDAGLFGLRKDMGPEEAGRVVDEMLRARKVARPGHESVDLSVGLRRRSSVSSSVYSEDFAEEEGDVVNDGTSSYYTSRAPSPAPAEEVSV